jgi:hypothetical protein
MVLSAQLPARSLHLSAQSAHQILGTKKGRMLKVTITDTATEEKWTLQGRLVWPWVNELRANWAKAQRAAKGRTRIVDLDEVRFIDESGERMLRTMSNQGAQLVASRASRNVLRWRAGGVWGDVIGAIKRVTAACFRKGCWSRGPGNVDVRDDRSSSDPGLSVHL